MNSIQTAFQINGIPFSETSEINKNVINKAAEKLKDLEDIILSFNKGEVLNIIYNNPSYFLIIDSKFPEDLTYKMVSAFINSR